VGVAILIRRDGGRDLAWLSAKLEAADLGRGRINMRIGVEAEYLAVGRLEASPRYQVVSGSWVRVNNGHVARGLGAGVFLASGRERSGEVFGDGDGLRGQNA